MKKYTYPAMLTIAGSDSGGGAGIQADIKTFAALGCYGMSAVTALTAQNTLGVSGIHSIPPDFVKAQLDAVLTDIKPHAIKIGMVHSPELVGVIASALKQYPDIPVILDPVMVATSGDRLIAQETVAELVSQLFPLTTLITPNLDEASLLWGMPITTVDQMHTAGQEIMQQGCNALLLKGGHLQQQELTTLLFTENGKVTAFTSNKIETKNMHGSGCTLSSAIAAYIARGEDLHNAVALAQKYVHNAIYNGKDVVTGKGHGPLNHFYNPEKTIQHEME
ncbi:bifunctional hydroxymethylpyrimidine kinase/phosphomethylpyrimidine kinase [Flavobacterium sp. Sd200]|uniref:bifunctional hydroxymethylpyrimidine kinase/phosphomethylpyrimidine kinase n=1 Tax=Flavobacterium sp. Sd200 TaxID=2692211 RepID=UPI00136DF706|nr:bifunctional hydroxymethylpyrimidine kinase/phosphomethylpyrimidine kinase [Flavobacterium sp. Sd200]MXN91059.1 bifunctional hydroxymethylpyrimidine kinase/phosphomethylpyrimidine kinase [Flavobacterium sp. Sd200]